MRDYSERYGGLKIWFTEFAFSRVRVKVVINDILLKSNKMELLQSQAPAERELLGNSAVRT